MQLMIKTALSLVDIGNSIIYHLLGRQLDSNDIKIINKLFIEDENYNWKELIRKINKGKDILLIKNNENFNLLQYSILKSKFDLIQYLLDYGCDSNRGSSLVLTSFDKCNCNEGKIFYDQTSNHTCKQLTCIDENECDRPLLLACTLYNINNLEYLLNGRPVGTKSRRHSSGISSLKTSSIPDLCDSNQVSTNKSQLKPFTIDNIYDSLGSININNNDDEDYVSMNKTDYLDIDDELYFEKYVYKYEYDVDDDEKLKIKTKKDDLYFNKINNLKDKRVRLVIDLLKSGADSLHYSYLSINSLKYLNLKSRAKLYQFTILNNLTLISPLLATICFDDLELFKIIFNHHKHLHGYLNDIYDLIRYSIRNNSIKCLVFLMNYQLNVDRITKIALENVRDHKLLSIINLNENSSTLLNEFFEVNKSFNDDLAQFIGYRSLYKIIYRILNDHDQCKFINSYTQSNELCIQKLFESKALLKTLFFYNYNEDNSQYQEEFKEILYLFSRYGAKFNLRTGQYDNIIDFLLSSLKLSAKINTKYLFNAEYLNEVLEILLKNDCFSLNGVLINKFLDLILVINIDEYEPIEKVFKLFAVLENKIDNKIDSSLLNRFFSNFLFKQNYLNSNQTIKIEFVRNILKILFENGYNPNDTAIKYINGGYLSSNNLLHNLISLVFQSKTCYQLNCLYDLIRFSLYYGANPNIEPFRVDAQVINLNGSFFKIKRTNHFIIQLCSHFNCEFFNGLSKYDNIENDICDCCCLANSQLIIFNDFYKKIIKLFYDIMDQQVINECLRSNTSLHKTSNILFEYLKCLNSTPRNLQSICRRSILSVIRKPHYIYSKKLLLSPHLIDFI